MADAFAVEIDTGLGGDTGALEVGGAHGYDSLGAGVCPARLGNGRFISASGPPAKPLILRQQVGKALGCKAHGDPAIGPLHYRTLDNAGLDLHQRTRACRVIYAVLQGRV